MKLIDLGYDSWFGSEISNPDQTSSIPARVITVNRDNYILKNTLGEVLAELTGKLLYSTESNIDLPVVGDWVMAEYFNDNTFAIIHSILPRKTLLTRKTAGKKYEFQPIAANIDYAFIVQSLDGNFNPRRLERYLVVVNQNKIEPIILLSKSDLITADELKEKMSLISEVTDKYTTIAFSNEDGENIDTIKSLLKKGLTYCMLGSSGVGKSTLLNRLIGEDILATNEVRAKDSKGRHTTSRRELIVLENGALMIDTPGMREFGAIAVETGIERTFADLDELTEMCRFKDCTHTKEAGCALLQAVNEGVVTSDRYQSYMKLLRESAFNEMSYLEKRQRDKKFGKMVKEIMKGYRKH
ncbi:ribosome small subunit-dependent GTPase A [candidate division KSB1 bacterium]|nr:ribosome small subunit-dependent GTPase A [candidate division KSB1 bacterium]